ncbi:MAG: LacI family DNA-binding transcriptional regulator [Limnochordia bacterium]|jgi:DNA-binding LacI/PurR family transcriptional regulator
MAKITLRMIAERAGVSVGTVSMVLNEKGNISEETRRNVKDIAQQLGYRRRRPGNGAVGITGNVPDSLVACLLQAAAEYGYSLHHFDLSNADTTALRSHVKLAGVIVYGGLWHPDLLAAVSRAYPTVLMGGSIPDTQVDSVWVDSSEGTSLATQYLIDHGHRTLGLINGPGTTITSWEKRIGFERVAYNHQHLQVKAVTVSTTEFTKEDGGSATRRLLRQHPDVTGIIAGNGNLGLGVLAALQELGMQVPTDISLVVFHDCMQLQNTTPPLTAIWLPELNIAREVVLHLVRRIQEPNATGRRLLLKPSLAKRASVAFIPH